jgi:heme-degrading monooxygenase HmoA
VILVLFSSARRPDVDDEEYGRTSARMREIVASIPGFISFNSYVSDAGEELILVRFDSLAALKAWRTHPEHLAAQENGRLFWFQEYWVQAASTDHDYRWTNGFGYRSDLRDKFVTASEIQPTSEPPDHSSET